MGSVVFSILTGLRKSIDLVFCIIIGMTQKGGGKTVSLLVVAVLS